MADTQHPASPGRPLNGHADLAVDRRLDARLRAALTPYLERHEDDFTTALHELMTDLRFAAGDIEFTAALTAAEHRGTAKGPDHG
jgi:hypothetical protein